MDSVRRRPEYLIFVSKAVLRPEHPYNFIITALILSLSLRSPVARGLSGVELVISDAHLRPRKSAPARRTRDSSGATYPTLPSRAIQAPGPRCQPAWAPDSAADRQNTLENPGVLDEDMRGLADRIEDMPEQRCAVIDWRASPDVLPGTTRVDSGRPAAIRKSGWRC